MGVPKSSLDRKTIVFPQFALFDIVALMETEHLRRTGKTTQKAQI
jgi:hypothetical protein